MNYPLVIPFPLSARRVTCHTPHFRTVIGHRCCDIYPDAGAGILRLRATGRVRWDLRPAPRRPPGHRGQRPARPRARPRPPRRRERAVAEGRRAHHQPSRGPPRDGRGSGAGSPGSRSAASRSTGAGPSYTADTLAELRRAHPEPSCSSIVGSDAAAGLTTWERVDEVRSSARSSWSTARGPRVRQPPAGWRWERVEVPRLDVSSTDLRARVADGRPLDLPSPA